MKKLIIGISGATGIIYSIKLLRCLKQLPEIETHLIITQAAQQTLRLETDMSLKELKALASYDYDIRDIGASLSSGSFHIDSMIVMPCSIKTLSAIVNSYSDNLLIRAADVTLKEKRPLVLMVRETPLHLGHLQLMCRAAELGAIIMPPMPAFYHLPKTIDDLIEQTINRILDQLAIQLPQDLFQRWRGNNQYQV